MISAVNSTYFFWLRPTATKIRTLDRSPVGPTAGVDPVETFLLPGMESLFPGRSAVA